MDEKQAYTTVFNLVAGLYDNDSLRFFPASAEEIVKRMDLQPGQDILDIATGTGVVALATARAAGNQVNLQAIDLSEKMLEQAKNKSAAAGIDNISFQLMDGENPDFNENSFDYITCSYGLFFMPEMDTALSNWIRLLKPGGNLIFTSFAPSAFRPLTDLFMQRLANYDITPPTPRWLQLAEPELCKDLLRKAGFENIQCSNSQLGYYLNDVDDWWRSIQSAGYRGLYEQLPMEVRDEFKKDHLLEVKDLKTNDGIWLDVETLFSTAQKPA